MVINIFCQYAYVSLCSYSHHTFIPASPASSLAPFLAPPPLAPSLAPPSLAPSLALSSLLCPSLHLLLCLPLLLLVPPSPLISPSPSPSLVPTPLSPSLYLSPSPSPPLSPSLAASLSPSLSFFQRRTIAYHATIFRRTRYATLCSVYSHTPLQAQTRPQPLSTYTPLLPLLTDLLSSSRTIALYLVFSAMVTFFSCDAATILCGKVHGELSAPSRQTFFSLVKKRSSLDYL